MLPFLPSSYPARPAKNIFTSRMRPVACGLSRWIARHAVPFFPRSGIVGRESRMPESSIFATVKPAIAGARIWLCVFAPPMRPPPPPLR